MPDGIMRTAKIREPVLPYVTGPLCPARLPLPQTNSPQCNPTKAKPSPAAGLASVSCPCVQHPFKPPLQSCPFRRRLTAEDGDPICYQIVLLGI